MNNFKKDSVKGIAFLLLFLSLHVHGVLAQSAASTTETNKPSITWAGFVKAEAMYDTRQVVEAREGYLLLYPKKVTFDKNGKDINAHGSFNQYAMIARLAAKISGPDVLNAKVTALIEGDFTGASNAENNSFRLRHAYLKLKWNHSSLIAGQYWHALNIPEMIPNVLSLNTGAPFHPFSRQPQFRFDYQIQKVNLVLSASAQRDYVNSGPAGASSVYLRNAIVPNIHAQLQFKGDKLFAGAGIDYKRLIPRLQTDSLFATNSAVNCLSYTAFAMLKTKPLIVKMQWIYGQGLNDHLVMGGYGVTYIDPVTNIHEYSALDYLSGWINVQTTGNIWQASLFAGYTRGFGAKEKITGPVFARDADIEYVYRIAPMLSFTKDKMVFSAEYEYTTAAYGKTTDFYKVIDSKLVSNSRISFSAAYFF